MCSEGHNPVMMDVLMGHWEESIEDKELLLDCDQGVSVDYSNLTNFFTWNRVPRVVAQVFIEFRFGQEIDIRNIRMIFWNSPNYSLIVPNIITQFPSHEISIITTELIMDRIY